MTVHNLGEEVERFSIEVNGPAGAFATAEPADLRMLPDKKQTAVIRFAPARSPQQPAGPQAFQVVARSTVNPDVAVPEVRTRARRQLHAGRGGPDPGGHPGAAPGDPSPPVVNGGNGPPGVGSNWVTRTR